MDATDRALLNAIQNDFPIAVHPYQILGDAVGTTEDDAYNRIQHLRQEGIIRRLGGVFDSRRLGYHSTLCAGKVPEEKISVLAELLEGIPGVTHNYLRDHTYNVWFTLIAPSLTVSERILQTIREVTGVNDIYTLPASRVFKINVNFDFDSSIDEQENEPDTSKEHFVRGVPMEEISPYELTDDDITLIRVLQGNLPDSPNPFEVLAESIQWPTAKVISAANRLLEEKILRRFGAVLRHQKAGFVANAMGVWQVDPEQADRVGQVMARFKEVSHCYQRPTLPDWPYNIFTMIHGRSTEDCKDIMKRISQATGVNRFSMLFSVAELKKSSMQYFLEEEN
ncbi:AsnC family transcriptional regulator [Desulfosporosinus sp.]|uniref:siroheme decarboxylase subunit beta n=1 Tax=Desulfosporosinus sp. TaxID=157907 RepID=UPI000E865732|nr:AsnC family transcriptional regulator [Desulfosporosinus sp.]MBC2723036.1 Lrp/AsnC family transcriptional regulator [Desulfosporosinus sp.]MBC2725017.1 Lrp/AsnC family transcriptional regulator [Desulfosporosinus sp.]HBV86361.1 Lrp/AsnC family transcriptional regulator [Desulfosporosinus sp.]